MKRSRMKPPSGLVLILGATVIASVASYLVFLLVPLQVGVAGYRPFGQFWSVMYVLVGALSGIQQEVTRATVIRPGGNETGPVVTADPTRRPPLAAGANPARNFGAVAAVTVFTVTVVTAPLWVAAVFPENGWALVLPLAVATASYAMVATLAGTLYGVSAWLPLALMISVDALLRIVAVGIAAIFSRDTVVLAWAASLPFLLTVAVLWPGIRRSVVGRTGLDVRYPALTWNVSRTIVAAASMGVLISGLPAVIGISAGDASAAQVASLFLVITLTRAPVIVTVMSLQSYLLIRFRDKAHTFWGDFLRIQAAIAVVGVVLALAAWAFAPAVFGFIYGDEIRLPGWFYAVLVISSALVGALAVSAPAVLSMSQHLIYSLGWSVAAVATVLCFALPVDLITKTVVALLVGPIAGLIVYAIYLISRMAAVARSR